MRLLRFDSESPAEHLACDEVLLRMAGDGAGGESLRFYEFPRPAVVLSIGGAHREGARLEESRRLGIPLLRRHSGGGTVLLGPGCLVYSLVLDVGRDPLLRSVRGSYRWILGRLVEALAGRGVPVEHAGLCDLAVEGRKVGGCAQHRRRGILLHHGTLLHGLDLSLPPEVLREPAEQPAYRAGRPHAEFLANLPLSRDELMEVVCSAFGAAGREEALPAETLGRIGELARSKYESDEWTLRR